MAPYVGFITSVGDKKPNENLPIFVVYFFMICNLKGEETSLSILSLSYKRKIINLSNINKQIANWSIHIWFLVSVWGNEVGKNIQLT